MDDDRELFGEIASLIATGALDLFVDEDIAYAQRLIRAGVPSDVANDPRVKGYFADRSVQYGP